MQIVTDCWEEATGERLKPDGPTALFGDRRHGRLEEDAAMHKHLHVPWQALHAATVLAVHEAQRRAGPHGDAKRPLEEGRQPKVWTTARSASARSFILWPSCARMCRKRTSMPLPRKRARARLFLFTSVRLLRAAHAPVVVQIASCESARTSTVVCVPCGSTSFARVSAW